ncbi:MAG: spondin domain-containing protein [Planctomycetota bacterium]
MYSRIAASAAALSLIAPLATAQSVSIPSVVVTVENLQPGRGMFLTPPWIALHDGSFDTYDGGSPASVPLGGNEIEALAEDGNNAPLTATFAATLPNAPQLEGVAGPTGPLGPGDVSRVTLQVNPLLDRYFSYASMVIPSNDAFIANGNPFAHEVFDANGNFVGAPFIVSGDETNDAGTEVNDEITSNVAFLGQAAPNTGTTENGVVVTPAADFAAPGALAFPDGILNHPVFGNGDFNDADDRLFGVSFRFVDLGAQLSFGSIMTPMAEVQPDIVVSSGFGTASVVSQNGSGLGLLARTEGLSGPITMAHLHLGAEGSNGPVVVDLGSGILGGVAVRRFVTEADLTGPLTGASFTDLLGEIAAGNVYLNIHTAQFPAGEVRGQIELID